MHAKCGYVAEYVRGMSMASTRDMGAINNSGKVGAVSFPE